MRASLWDLKHTIDEESPLWPLTQRSQTPHDHEGQHVKMQNLKVKISGTEPRLHAETSAIRVYLPSEIKMGECFVDAYSMDPAYSWPEGVVPTVSSKSHFFDAALLSVTKAKEASSEPANDKWAESVCIAVDQR